MANEPSREVPEYVLAALVNLAVRRSRLDHQMNYVLRAALDLDGFFFTDDIDERVDLARNTVHYHLRKLHRLGLIGREKCGTGYGKGSRYHFWLTPLGRLIAERLDQNGDPNRKRPTP